MPSYNAEKMGAAHLARDNPHLQPASTTVAEAITEYDDDDTHQHYVYSYAQARGYTRREERRSRRRTRSPPSYAVVEGSDGQLNAPHLGIHWPEHQVSMHDDNNYNNNSRNKNNNNNNNLRLAESNESLMSYKSIASDHTTMSQKMAGMSPKCQKWDPFEEGIKTPPLEQRPACANSLLPSHGLREYPLKNYYEEIGHYVFAGFITTSSIKTMDVYPHIGFSIGLMVVTDDNQPHTQLVFFHPDKHTRHNQVYDIKLDSEAMYYVDEPRRTQAFARLGALVQHYRVWQQFHAQYHDSLRRLIDEMKQLSTNIEKTLEQNSRFWASKKNLTKLSDRQTITFICMINLFH